MRFEKRKVGSLSFYPQNPRKMTSRDYSSLLRSLSEFGVVEPLVINEAGQVIGGNQRLKAIRELFGDDYEVDCIVVSLPKEKEKALNLALNRITGEFDFSLLSEFIQDLPQELYELTGFTESELSVLGIEFERSSLVEKLDQQIEETIGSVDSVAKRRVNLVLSFENHEKAKQWALEHGFDKVRFNTRSFEYVVIME